jgi:integrase-like protein
MSCFGPCHFKLKEALDRAERKSEFLLTTQLGSGHSDGAFCNMIAESTARIGAKEYTAHGLRKNAAIALAEAGCTVHQIMAITGHALHPAGGSEATCATGHRQARICNQSGKPWNDKRTKDWLTA